jgi:protein phosphatase
VTPKVEVATRVALHPGDTMLLCSDGLWGALSDHDIGEAFGRLTVMRAVPELMDTAIAMSWAGAESIDMVPPTDTPVSTLVIPEGSIASTVQMPRPGDPSPDEPLTEEQIDDAIAEIQRAIQQSSRLIQNK